MAHEITNTDSILTFAQPAWHSLGTTLPANHIARRRFDLAFQESGLDWELGLAPMKVAGDFEDKTVAGLDVEGFNVVYRKDTGERFSPVGSRYHILQNVEQFRFFQPFLEAGEAELDVCGSLRGGRIVWVLAQINREDAVVVKDSQKPDVIKKYLLLMTSHDMSYATHVGYSPVRVVCMNTMAMALRKGESELIRVRHTANQISTLEQVRETINLADQNFEATAAQYRRLAQTAINKDDLVKYVKIVHGIDPTAEVKTRTQNKLDKIVEMAFSGMGAEMSQGTLWGGYNAITQYITHEATRTAETRLLSQWNGEGRDLAAKALEIALQMAG